MCGRSVAATNRRSPNTSTPRPCSPNCPCPVRTITSHLPPSSPSSGKAGIEQMRKRPRPLGPGPVLHQGNPRHQGPVHHQRPLRIHHQSPHLARAHKKRRCIVPADSFYEWSKVTPPLKTPYSFELTNGQPIAFAGFWDAWKDPAGNWLQSFAIATTEANELMSRVHPRMPCILHPRDFDRWLDREETERLPVDLLRPLPSAEMEMFEAHPNVGNVRNNGPELMRKAEKAAEDGVMPL